MLLFRQQLIHNSKLMIYSSAGFCGVVFLILSIGQSGNDLKPFDAEVFIQMMATFVSIFGVLYVGHSFPAFRSKEGTSSYLTVPASIFEKFLFEVLNRIVLLLIVLPFLFWLTFNMEGLFFELITYVDFDPVGFTDLRALDLQPLTESGWLQVTIAFGALLIFVIPFTGAAIFSRQPLVKTLFSVAMIILFYTTVTYVVIEPLGLKNYEPSDSMWLFPSSEQGALKFFACLAILTNAVMLTVTFLKLKEKEV